MKSRILVNHELKSRESSSLIILYEELTRDKLYESSSKQTSQRPYPYFIVDIVYRKFLRFSLSHFSNFGDFIIRIHL